MNNDKSISKTLSHINTKICDLESRATRATRKYLEEIGITKRCVNNYTVNRAHGGEWILDSEDGRIELSSHNIMVGDDLTIEEIRYHTRYLSDEEKMKLGLL